MTRARSHKRRPPARAFHPDCSQCCAVGRCHWCLDKPETFLIARPNGDHFRVCQGCAPLVRRQVANLIGHDGVQSFGLEGVTVTPLTALAR